MVTRALAQAFAMAPAPAVDPDALVAAWASSGGMAITGWDAEAPLVATAGVMAVAADVCAAFSHLAERSGHEVSIGVAEALFGRAGVRGLGRHGRTSAGGSCRLLRTSDAWIAVSLARTADLEAVNAVIRSAAPGDAWRRLLPAVARLTAAEALERCSLVGIPAALLGEASADPAPAVKIRMFGRQGTEPTAAPLVVDLSSLWAGPLCARLLSLAGAHVVKVESRERPDGARRGNRMFFDWLHEGHSFASLAFSDPSGITTLRRLLERADIVIESSRPRALRQLGIFAEDFAARGTTWVSIGGYGRDSDGPGRTAFGDDAAVAGGLVALDCRQDPVFCADALADPLTGLVAAAEGLGAFLDGGGALVDVAMSRVAAGAARRCSALGASLEGYGAHIVDGGWVVATRSGNVAVAQPVPVVPRLYHGRTASADNRWVISGPVASGHGVCE